MREPLGDFKLHLVKGATKETKGPDSLTELEDVSTRDWYHELQDEGQVPDQSFMNAQFVFEAVPDRSRSCGGNALHACNVQLQKIVV